MAKNRQNKFVIHGVSPEGTEHEWTGCGWGDTKTGKFLSDVDSWILERLINTEGLFTCWRVEA